MKNDLGTKVRCKLFNKKILNENGSISVEAMVIFPIFLLVVFAMINVVAQAVIIIRVEKSAADTLMLCNEEYYMCRKIDRAVSDSTDSIKIVNAVKNFTSFLGEDIEKMISKISGENAEGLLSGETIFKGVSEAFLDFSANKRLKKYIGDEENNLNLKSKLSLSKAGFTDSNKDYEIKLRVEYEPDVIKTPFFEAGKNETNLYTRGWGTETETLKINLTKKSEETDTTVYVTRTGECYHKKSCHNSLDESCIPILLEAAKISGYRNCKLCKP